MKSYPAHVALTFVIAITGACAPGSMDTGEAVVAVITEGIPDDGACVLIRMTRLGDFRQSEYRGPIADATFKTFVGDTRVTAHAFPPPCDDTSMTYTWVADEQIASFGRGDNDLFLKFRPNVHVFLESEFDDDVPAGLEVIGESIVRIGRNGEDIAGPGYALDGWEVKSFGVPPATVGEAVLFSTQGLFSAPPRGIAALPDGRLVLQGTEPTGPVFLFDGAANFLGGWPVTYAAGLWRAGFVDGLDAIDGDTLVRTAFMPEPVACGQSMGCLAALEILEVRAAGPTTYLEVTQQIFIPEAGLQLNFLYPLGVTSAGGLFYVSLLDTNPRGYLIALAPDGTLVASPVAVDAPEGLFVDDAGRLITMDYRGRVRGYSAADLSVDVSANVDYTIGVDLVAPRIAAWRSANDTFLVFNDWDLFSVSADLSTASSLGLDLSGFVEVGGFDYLPGVDQLAVVDVLPPMVSGTRVPTVVLFDLATLSEVGSVQLELPVTGPVRVRSIAYLASTHQFATTYRRPASAPDAALDATVFVHHADGTLSHFFDLAPFGFPRVGSVNAGLAPGELLVRTADAAGIPRIVITSTTGTPLRSFRLNAWSALGDLAPIHTGSFAGQLGLFQREPSVFARALSP